MQRRTAIIAGASGLVGGYCLEALLADPAISEVVALVRKPLPHHAGKLRQQVTSFEDLKLRDAPEAVVFCALGTTIKKAGSEEAFRRVDFDYPLRLAEAGRKAGATSFVLVSSVGASAASGTFYLRVKGELEEKIATLGYPSLHIFRPSVLMGERTEERTGESMGIALAKVMSFALVGGLSKYQAVEGSDVGRAMARVANNAQPGVHVYHRKEIAVILAH